MRLNPTTIGRGIGTNGFLGSHTEAWGTETEHRLDRLDPDEWLERHRLQLERPETKRYRFNTLPAGTTPAQENSTS